MLFGVFFINYPKSTADSTPDWKRLRKFPHYKRSCFDYPPFMSPRQCFMGKDSSAIVKSFLIGAELPSYKFSASFKNSEIGSKTKFDKTCSQNSELLFWIPCRLGFWNLNIPQVLHLCSFSARLRLVSDIVLKNLWELNFAKHKFKSEHCSVNIVLDCIYWFCNAVNAPGVFRMDLNWKQLHNCPENLYKCS